MASNAAFIFFASLLGFSFLLVSSDALPASCGGRHLLQTVSACPTNLESLNYTVVTSVCKAPSYNVTICCSSFVTLVCTFVDDFNNQSTSCASDFFGYLNAAGNYTAGLFSDRCVGDKLGLACPSAPAPAPAPNAAAPFHHNIVLGLVTLSTVLFLTSFDSGISITSISVDSFGSP